MPRTLTPLEVLNGAFVFLGGRTRPEGPKVPPLARLGVLLSRVESVLAVLELTDHECTRGSVHEYRHS